jgi:hypothetical protein
VRTLSLLVAAVLVLLSPSTAMADETTVTDATDDVYGSVPEGFEQVEPVGTQVNTDLRRTVVEHRARALVVTVRYDDLVKRASASIRYEAYINMRGDGADMSLFVDIRPSLRRASVRLVDFCCDVACSDTTATVKPAKDKLTVRVPRSCLGDPAWIRYRGQALSTDDADRLYLDYDNTSGSKAKGSHQTKRLYADH